MTHGSPVLVTGATGTIGRRLLSHLPGARVLSRDAARASSRLGVPAFAWDGAGEVPREALEGVSAVVHLAGEPVAEGRWTPQKKRAIEASRVEGTRALVASLRKHDAHPTVLVSASAVGFYGDRGDEVLDEASSPGSDFLAGVCVGWEREAREAEALGVRVVCLRLGVVFDREGGALPRMRAPFLAGVGGPLGTGRQWVPWVHADDVVGLALHALEADVRGPLDVVSPEPVRNESLTRAIAAALHRPAFLRVPAFALRAALGEVAAVVLASQRVVPRVATASGYRFRHPTLEGALRDLLAPAR